jgi:hypothetical protein
MRPRTLLALTTTLVLLACVCARADSIVLKNGRTMSGTIIKETDEVVVIEVASMGRMTVERSRIREVRRAGGSRPTPRPSPRPARRPERPARAAPPSVSPANEKAPPAPEGPAHAILLAYIDKLPTRDEVATQSVWDTLKQLKPLSRKATPDLRHALRWSPDWRVRLLAARALKALEDKTATPELIHALGDPWQGGVDGRRGSSFDYDPGYPIRNLAAQALQVIGAEAHDALRTVAADAEHADQVHALTALSRMGVPDRLDLLLRVAKDRAQRPECRQAATASLAHQTEAQKTLVSLLSDPKVGTEAERALVLSRDRKALEPLVGLVRRAAYDFETARRAARCISAIDRRWKPSESSAAVDYMLLSGQAARICSVLGNRATGRLRYWQNAGNREMQKLATLALSRYRRGGG